MTPKMKKIHHKPEDDTSQHLQVKTIWIHHFVWQTGKNSKSDHSTVGTNMDSVEFS